MARNINNRPEEMVELTISTDQFRSKTDPSRVTQAVQLEADKIIRQMVTAVRSVVGTADKLLEGIKSVDEATGAVTQKLYVSKRIAEKAKENLANSSDIYASRYDEDSLANPRGISFYAGGRDVRMAERRINYESARAQRSGVRDFERVGGFADTGKYRDAANPYATAAYIPLDSVEYASRSGRSRAGWVQAQFNRVVSDETRSERSLARERQAAAARNAQDREAEKQAVEERRREERQDRIQSQAAKARQRAEEKRDREAERQAAEERRREERQDKLQAHALRATQRAEEKRQREEQAKQKALEREEDARRKELNKAEEKSNRERLAVFMRIAAMLTTVVALVRGVTTSLLNAATKSAGTAQARLPESYDLSLPLVNGLKDAISKVDFLGIFSPLVDAVLETAQKIRVQTLEGYRTGLTAGQVRLYDLNDMAHQLSAGTTVQAMKGLLGNTNNILSLSESGFGDEIANILFGKNGTMHSELVSYASGTGSKELSQVFEDIIDIYFKQYLSGKSVLGNTTSPEQLRSELVGSIETIAPGAGAVLGAMMDNYSDGYYSSFGNFEEWMSSTRLMQMMQQGTFEIPKETLDYNNTLSLRLSELEAELSAIADKFLAGMYTWLDEFLAMMDTLAYYFMDDADKARVDAQNRKLNKQEIDRLTPMEEDARKKAAAALGISEEELQNSVSFVFGEAIPGYRPEGGMTDEELARYMYWVQTKELLQAATDDYNSTGRVAYDKTRYTPEGLAAYQRLKTEKYLKQQMNLPVNGFGLASERGLSAEVVSRFLGQVGYTGSVSDVMEALFSSAVGAADWEKHRNEMTNLTDLLDEIVRLNAPGIWKGTGALVPGTNDLTQSAISAFYTGDWATLSGEQREALTIQALRSLRKLDSNLPGISTVRDKYNKYFSEAEALVIADQVQRAMDFNMSGPVSAHAARTHASVPVSNTSYFTSEDTLLPEGADGYEADDKFWEQVQELLSKKYFAQNVMHDFTDFSTGELVQGLMNGGSVAKVGTRTVNGKLVATLRVDIGEGLRKYFDVAAGDTYLYMDVTGMDGAGGETYTLRDSAPTVE